LLDRERSGAPWASAAPPATCSRTPQTRWSSTQTPVERPPHRCHRCRQGPCAPCECA